MILTDNDIKKRLSEGSIIIKPSDNRETSPCSIDLRLSNKFRTYKRVSKTHIDPYTKTAYEEYTELTEVKDDEPFILHPGEFVLASTLEWVEMPTDLAARIDGRSSLGRLGIIIETAAMVDPGFKGHITLEVANIGKMPVAIYPKMRICRMTFYKLTGECTKPYDGKYVKQKEAEGSKIEKDYS